MSVGRGSMAVREQDKFHHDRDADYQRRRFYLPWLIVTVGVILSVAAYFLVRDWEEAIIARISNCFPPPMPPPCTAS